jgi:hypothetical protein
VLGEIELLAGVRGERESDKAVQACNDYLRMGPGRSLRGLVERYQTATEAPPTQRLKSLKDWSRFHTWQDRAAAYDAAVERQKNDALDARRREVMERGLALDYERVKKLERLAELLESQVHEEAEDATGQARYPNVWLRDFRNISGVIPGMDEEEDGIIWKREVIYRFNSALIDQYRGTLDDIAKETGGRKQQTDNLLRYVDFSKLSAEQVDRIAAGEDPIRVLFGG